MKKVIVFAAALSVAACNQADTANTDATPTATETTAAAESAGSGAGFEAVAPGNYEIVRAGGKIDALTVHPGLTWSMVAADGTASGGTIFAQGGKNCFVTEGVEGHRCFQGSTPSADGAMEVKGDDGEVATVRPVGASKNSPEI
jgi:hypothetical protein